jgi:polyhydroxyalkanoate synthesis regulator phasin
MASQQQSSKVQEATSEAKEKGREVVQSASEEGKAVGHQAVEEGKAVASEAAAQAGHVVDDVKSQLQTQAQEQAKKVAQSLRKAGDDVQALAQGKPQEAGQLSSYVEQAAGKLHELAGQIESRGYEGVVQDVQRFARRRPGAFLLGAVTAGFLSGRVFSGLKPEQQGQSQSGQGGGQQPTAAAVPPTPAVAAPVTPPPTVPPAGTAPVVEPAPVAAAQPAQGPYVGREETRP